MILKWYLLPLFSLLFTDIRAGILYPRATETREVISLDGLWDFALSEPANPSRGHVEKWYEKRLRNVDDIQVQLMAVPSSYNDIGTSVELRDHAGSVWYQRTFIIPSSWEGQKVWVRFSSVSYSADVWINDNFAVSHYIGHLPFQADVSNLIEYGAENTITVLVDNTLNSTTVPQGSTVTLSSGRVIQQYNFDFFNYAGIDRPVVLYTTPNTYIDDINVTTEIDETTGLVHYDVVVEGDDEVRPRVTLYDKQGHPVVFHSALAGTLEVEDANLWWPYLVDPEPGYLYTLEVILLGSDGNLLDRYTQKIGIRTISWDSNSLRVNGRRVYLRGFGRHEDSDFRGRGLDLPLIVRDHNLILWSGANAYRQSYYPYAEEILDLTDELGILVTDESPAVALSVFSDELLETHKASLTQLIQRDKNRPSVFLWSAASGSVHNNDASYNHFKEVTDHIRSLDKTRPLTIVFNSAVDNAGELVDIASINIYQGWSDDTGDLDAVTYDALQVIRDWREAYDIPIIVSEYGADSEEGFHILPTFVWSEDYQVALLEDYFEVFDIARDGDGLVGEFVWNFADFNTPQNYLKLGGNKKGVFSRNRQPKLAAYILRDHYWDLAEDLDNAKVPKDVRRSRSRRRNALKTEL